jgi:hypothetical protein
MLMLMASRDLPSGARPAPTKNAKPPGVFPDEATETALLVTATMPIAVAAAMAWSFLPLLLAVGPAAIALQRRRFVALVLIAVVLSLGAAPVAYMQLNVH